MWFQWDRKIHPHAHPGDYYPASGMEWLNVIREVLGYLSRFDGKSQILTSLKNYSQQFLKNYIGFFAKELIPIIR